MVLSADRLEVGAGERIRGVMVVHPPRVVTLAAGGLKHLVHEIQDVGFEEVGVFLEPPESWSPASNTEYAGNNVEWLLWFEATSAQWASHARDLTSDLCVADAWPALDDAHQFRGTLHPYAVTWGETIDLGGGIRAFGVTPSFEVH